MNLGIAVTIKLEGSSSSSGSIAHFGHGANKQHTTVTCTHFFCSMINAGRINSSGFWNNNKNLQNCFTKGKRGLRFYLHPKMWAFCTVEKDIVSSLTSSVEIIWDQVCVFFSNRLSTLAPSTLVLHHSSSLSSLTLALPTCGSPPCIAPVQPAVSSPSLPFRRKKWGKTGLFSMLNFLPLSVYNDRCWQ